MGVGICPQVTSRHPLAGTLSFHALPIYHLICLDYAGGSERALARAAALLNTTEANGGALAFAVAVTQTVLVAGVRTDIRFRRTCGRR